MARRTTSKITDGLGQKVLKKSRVTAQLKDLLLLDPYLDCFEDIAKRIRRLDQSNRNRLLSICDNSFGNVTLRKDEPTRVACAKVILALVPDSTDSIKHWINTKSGKYIYEVHFSLFCFFDNVPFLSKGKKFASEIPFLIERYLLEVDTETAQAAFMAGDLLGDHWQNKESLPILIKLAKEAKYVAGRNSAIHGLTHVFSNLAISDPNRELITSVLRFVAEKDKSKDVKITARMALENKF